MGLCGAFARAAPSRIGAHTPISHPRADNGNRWRLLKCWCRHVVRLSCGERGDRSDARGACARGLAWPHRNPPTGGRSHEPTNDRQTQTSAGETYSTFWPRPLHEQIHRAQHGVATALAYGTLTSEWFRTCLKRATGSPFSLLACLPACTHACVHVYDH